MVLKLPLLATSLAEDIHEIFGDKIKIIFSSRMPRPSIISLIKACLQISPLFFHEEWIQGLGLPYGEKYDDLYQSFCIKIGSFNDAEVKGAAYGAAIASKIFS